MLGIQNEREWAAFCTHVLERPALARDARYGNNTKRTAARTEIVALVEQAFSAMTADQAAAKLDAAGIANGRMNGGSGRVDDLGLLGIRRDGAGQRQDEPTARGDDPPCAIARVHGLFLCYRALTSHS